MCAEKPEQAHYMYVLSCADGSWYTGYTTDVARRLAAHNAGRGARYTRAHGPCELVACARFATKHEALSAEARFKRLPRPHKEELVAQAQAQGRPFEDILAERFAGLLATPGGAASTPAGPAPTAGPA